MNVLTMHVLCHLPVDHLLIYPCSKLTILDYLITPFGNDVLVRTYKTHVFSPSQARATRADTVCTKVMVVLVPFKINLRRNHIQMWLLYQRCLYYLVLS